MKRIIMGLGLISLVGCASPDKTENQRKSTIRTDSGSSSTSSVRKNTDDSSLQNDLSSADKGLDALSRELDAKMEKFLKAQAEARAFEAAEAEKDRAAERSNRMIDTVMQMGMIEMMSQWTLQGRGDSTAKVKCIPKPNYDALMNDVNAMFQKADEQVKAAPAVVTTPAAGTVLPAGPVAAPEAAATTTPSAAASEVPAVEAASSPDSPEAAPNATESKS